MYHITSSEKILKSLKKDRYFDFMPGGMKMKSIEVKSTAAAVINEIIAVIAAKKGIELSGEVKTI